MIIGNMATFPARKDTLESAVHNIARQVDMLNLCLNEYTEIPSWIDDHANVRAIIPQTDLKDLGKFMFEVDGQDDVFLVDDDLHYPADYVSQTLEIRERYNLEHCVVGYHGTIYRHPGVMDILRATIRNRTVSRPRLGQCKDLHAYNERLDRPRVVAQIGTGTVLAKGHMLPDLTFMIGADRRADVRFARWSFDRNTAQIALPRRAGWIPGTEDDSNSIWKTYTSKLPEEFVDEIKAFAFDVQSLGDYLEARA